MEVETADVVIQVANHVIISKMASPFGLLAIA